MLGLMEKNLEWQNDLQNPTMKLGKLLSGFIGVTQNEHTNAISPCLGWILTK